jgi:protein MpaA
MKIVSLLFELMVWKMKILNILVFVTAVFLAGCGGGQEILTVASPYHSASEFVGRYDVVGTSVENRRIESLVLGQGDDVIFVIASIHGNENVGTPLVLQLTEYLYQHQDLLEGRKVVLLPVANPDGVFYNSRFNARGVDLNRNFSAANRRNNEQFGQAGLSEPEARIIGELIETHDPNRIVTIHQISKGLGCIDYDGPGKELAERMGEYCPLVVEKIGAQPGSLGSYAGETLGIAIITVELPREHGGFNSQRLWQRYGGALVAAVLYPEKAKLK